MATTVNINATENNCMLRALDQADYAIAHDLATADDIGTNKWLGQYKSLGKYTIMRNFYYFVTSSIPDDAIIINAKIKLYIGDANALATAQDNFNIVVRHNTGETYPSEPLVKSDFDYTFYTGDGGSISVNSLDIGWNDLWFNSTGHNWINKTGTTKLVLISSRDINAVVPDRNEFIYMSLYPILTVTYSVESYPTTTSQVATNTGTTYCTANGTLTDGGVATEWGFEYGESETPTWKVTSTINIGEGTFSLGIPGLKPSTTYYYRAYCTNSYGTAYGGWVSFTTSALASYGIHEESNTATICFYISEDDGKTWGQKHGPYTTDQADIEVTKLLVRGSGKKKIKFESDTLTGISASIMCKLDLKAR